MRQRLLLLLAALVVSSHGWSIEFFPPAQILATKKTGDNIMVLCRVSGATGASFRWLKNGEPMPSHGRVRTRGNQMFIIAATQADAGDYTCEATVGQETMQRDVPLTFYKAVAFVDAPAQQHPIVGEIAQIKCKVEGDPAPMITWRRGSEEITTGIGAEETIFTILRTNSVGGRYMIDEAGQILLIENYSSDDDGMYVCEATQPSSGTFETRFIDVFGHVRPRIDTFPGEEVTMYEGEDVMFKCGGYGVPPPEYFWYKGTFDDAWTPEQAIKDSDKHSIGIDGILKIRKIYSGDDGIYTCVAANSIGKAHMQVKLTVFTKPVVEVQPSVQADVGESVQLVCTFTGDGNISAFWIFNRRALDGNVGEQTNDRFTAVRDGNTLTLTIRDVTVDDADDYLCETSNDAGSDQATTRVLIKHAPVMMEHTTEIIRAHSGNRAILMCNVDAVPAPEWLWKDPHNNTITIDGSKYFEISPVEDTGRCVYDVRIEKHSYTLSTELAIVFGDSASEYGDYTCEAHNEVSRRENHEPARATVTVVQIVPPPTPERLMFVGQHPTYANATVDSYNQFASPGELPTSLRFQFVEESIYVEREQSDGKMNWSDTSVVNEVTVDYVNTNFYLVPHMNTNSEYRVRVRGENEAGTSEWSLPEPYTTSHPTVPGPPPFDSDAMPLDERGVRICDEYCTVHWREPQAHGAEITGYFMEYTNYGFDSEGIGSPTGSWIRYPSELYLPAHEHSAKMQAFAPDHYYIVRLYALNTLGEGAFSEAVFRTPENMRTIGTGMSAGIVVLIIFIVLLVVFLGIDLFCYMARECGLLWCLSASVFGARHGSQKGTSRNDNVMMEEGTKKETIIADENSERTPMMTTISNGEHHSGKATTV